MKTFTIHIGVVFLVSCGVIVLLNAQAISWPLRCTTPGYFGPTAAGEPCFDNAHSEVTRCDYVVCIFYPAYNIWTKTPYICPGDETDVYDPVSGCGPLPATTVSPGSG